MKYRSKLNAKVIAITGSNGKTSVKDMVAYMLNGAYKTQGNYNNQIGLPLTILNAPINSKYIVLELGMSERKEIIKLSRIARPDYSIITNIGQSHLEFLKSLDNVFLEKTDIIKCTKYDTIVSGNDEYLKKLNNVHKPVVSNCKVTEKGTKFIYNNEEYEMNLYGQHNASNMALVIKLLELLKEKISKKRMKKINITNMRFQIINKDNKIYINDAYNASPISMIASLNTLDKIYKDKDKILVLGDMLELGEDEIQLHKSIEPTLKSMNYKKVFLYGSRIANVDAINSYKTNNIEEIKQEIDKLSDCVVFLKASRSMKLERIIKGDN